MNKVTTYILSVMVLGAMISCTKDPDIPSGLKSLQRVGGWEDATPSTLYSPPYIFGARSNATVAVWGDCAFILGGGDLNDGNNQICWKYVMTGATVDYTSTILPLSVSGAISFAVNGRLYYGLGVNNSGMQRSIYYTSINGNELGSWTPLNTSSLFPGTGRNGAVAFVINNKAYVGLGNSGSTYPQDLYEFTPETMKWKRMADIPSSGRQDAAVFVLGGKAYICCGYNDYYLNETWQFDPAKNTWVQVANLPGIGRDDAVAFAFEKRGYVGTGWNNVHGIQQDFWEYNPVSNKWIASAGLNGPTGARYGAIAWAKDNVAYVATGNNQIDLSDFWRSTLK